MSADEYVECPICHGLPEELREGYEKYYGTVTAKEYDAIKQKYNSLGGEPTVPVYYEIELKSDGTVSLGLGAECTGCHAEWKHDGVVK